MKYLRHLFCSAFFCAVFSASGEEMPNILRNEALSFEVGGHVGERLSANEKTWLVPLLENNPDLFGAFLRPDSNTLFKCMWHGEFPGKILAGVAQTYLATRNPATLTVGRRMTELLARSQRSDGYLGALPLPVRTVSMVPGDRRPTGVGGRLPGGRLPVRLFHPG